MKINDIQTKTGLSACGSTKLKSEIITKKNIQWTWLMSLQTTLYCSICHNVPLNFFPNIRIVMLYTLYKKSKPSYFENKESYSCSIFKHIQVYVLKQSKNISFFFYSLICTNISNLLLLNTGISIFKSTTLNKQLSINLNLQIEK